MKKIINKKKCNGCSACANVCPKNAIEMIKNEEGFKYPVINSKKCINCNLCKKKCPIINTKKNKSLNICYAGYNKDKNSTLKKASSGNIFELIATYILNEKGIVFGAAFDNNNNLKHIMIDNIKDLHLLKGAKYLQSDISDIYIHIKKHIKTKKILFVGTPCQVASIKSIFQNNTNLYCIDLICHGVPSPKLFKKYITELEKQENQKVIEYNFRDKITGWDKYSNTITFNNKIITEEHTQNIYMQLFLSDIALRTSCYNCNFKLGNKYSDITLGDFWGIKKKYPNMYNNNYGVSAIIINTNKGMEIFNNIKNNIKYHQCHINEILESNRALKYSPKYHKKRKKFFQDLDKQTINSLNNKYIYQKSIKKTIVNIIRKFIKRNY